jgi:hypothetical protein
MQEILPGIFHWTAFHRGIMLRVHSYYVESAHALIDPMLPKEGIEPFRDRPPERILLTNRHHYRKSGVFAEAFGCPVLCHESGLHEFAGGPEVRGFSFGDEVAPGVVALEVGAICPEETALHVREGHGLLAFADGVIRRRSGSLAFVPNFLLGDDPEAVKRGLRESFRRLLECEFDSLLFAHGAPIVGRGKAALREFVDRSQAK